MVEITSSLKSTVNEFADAANWITNQIYSWKNLKMRTCLSVEINWKHYNLSTEKFERSFRTNHVVLDEDCLLKLENASSSLWNAISIELKSEQNLSGGTLLLCRCKLFAAILLSLFDSLDGSSLTRIRSFQCYVTVLRTVVEFFIQEPLTDKSSNVGRDKKKELLTKAQEHAYTNFKVLEESQFDWKPAEGTEIQKLKFKFYLLNFQISLQEGDFETATLYSTKMDIENNLTTVDANLLLEICRQTYNAVLSSSKKVTDDSQGGGNVKLSYFAKQAYSLLKLPVDNLQNHVDYNMIKFSLLVFLVNNLVEQYNIEANCEECELYLNALETSYPKKIEPFALYIKYYKKKGCDNLDQSIEEVLMKMISSVDIAPNFAQVLECAKELVEVNIKMGATCLDYILSNKLEPEKDKSILEKLIVARFFIITQSKTLTADEIASSLSEFCDLVERILTTKLSKDTVSCIVTLLWNAGKKLDKSGEYPQSVMFYTMALRKILSEDYTDKGKLQRALQAAYINLEEFVSVSRVFEEMTEEEQNHPLTQLLMLKEALSRQDTQGAISNLKNIKCSNTNTTIDALILGITYCKNFKDVTLEAINLLFEKLEEAPYTKESSDLQNWTVPTVSLVRYTIQLIIKLVEKKDPTVLDDYLLRVENLLMKAKSFVLKSRLQKNITSTRGEEGDTHTEPVSIDEIEWFASVAYNFAAKCHAGGDIERSRTFSEIATEYVDLIPGKEFTFPKMFHYFYWKYRCLTLNCFTCGKMLTSRGVDGKEVDELEERIKRYMEELLEFGRNEKEANLNEADERKLKQCYLDLLSVLFELILFSKDTQKVHKILHLVETSPDPEVDSTIVNNLLAFEGTPQYLKKEILSAIIKRNVTNDGLLDNTLCTWIRKYLETDSFDDVIKEEEKIVKTLLKRLEMGAANHQEAQFDIEVIATLAWNRGVNSLILANTEGAIAWCMYSIKFASIANPGLKDQLKGLWSSLATSADITRDRVDELLCI
ncbi:Spo22p KNAG_0C04200 [Huiozyma naganishii CBS 8797]|uniref:Protein ZIP4 homolog n=1 Tax=Huiozyma naganishii (strain ATCC MYA-139 / BCRC 22969 / CBS 8797 / KCTC 17520 / NBRC 10181 / NCYC 3082 / Yp74L-3) TaxID=1071383 RepID=J7RWX7_HUIN7|nr:hypothetical protein KNAG_0C04200 [Kazachstania naganishii CBS 8797]CCK69522.1 hypothetical protein KNAG_0C04200 [Kazachstania naganishii CBS 8797]